MTAPARVDGAPARFVLPTSPAQRRLWFLDRLNPGHALYTVHAAVPLGEISPRLAQEALDDLVRRHESLRTTFTEAAGEPVQVVHEAVRVPVRLVDLLRLPAADRDAALERVDAEQASRPFDLVTGPLLRVAMVRSAPSRHLLLVTMHHIVSDGWSMTIFFRDFAECYTARAERRPAGLPELRVHYADFAVWQAERLARLGPEHLAFWRDRLADAPTVELPTDRPRPPMPSFAGAAEGFTLPARVVSRLMTLARAEGATMFMTLLAGFLLTLHDYSGQDDLVVGVPVAGRDRSELEPLVGFFVNMLVVRSEVRAADSFRELLRRVRGAVLDAFSHQELPFDRVVEEVQRSRDLSRHPLFQLAFQLHHRPDTADLPGAGPISTPAVPRTSSNFDQHLELWRDGGALAGRLTYATDLFDAETIRLQALHFRRLMQLVAADPDRPVGVLDVLGERERRQLLAWGVGAGTWHQDVSVVDLVEAAVDRSPDAVALRSRTGDVGYAELDRRANAIAHGLLARGLRRGEPVGVLADRSTHLVAALLGVLKAGGGYLGVEPDEPPERVRELLGAVRCRFLLALGGRAERLVTAGIPAAGVSVLPLEGPAAVQAGQPDSRPAVRVRPQDLAYVSFTSGSTGTPKGVAVPHRGVVRLVTGTSFRTISAAETFLLLSPIAFDASTMEVWGPLTHGAHLVVHPPGPFSLSGLVRLVRATGVTTLWLTAGLFHQLVDEELPRLTGVRTFLTGGDVVSAAHVRRVLALPQRPVVINAYGPAENGSYTTCHVMRDPAAVPDRVPIGRPISGTTVFVLDAALRPVPVGVPGELWTGGEGLATGYVGDPEATAKVFVSGPFEHVPADRLYRTGDRARWRRDGTLEFLGRADRQVKVRGFRVEPGEVEAALTALPQVRDAAVVAVGDAADDRRLAAFVVAAVDGTILHTGDVRAALARTLPRYLVPSLVRQVPRLPLIRSGKVDRAALTQLLRTPDATAGGVMRPRTRMEAALAPIWAEVLGVDEVGVTADFFADLGGHSLLGTRLVARVRDAFDVDLPLRALFESPDVAGMAVAVESLLLDDLQHRQVAVGRPPGEQR